MYPHILYTREGSHAISICISVCWRCAWLSLFREEDVCKQKQGRQNIMVTMSISWDLSEPKKKHGWRPCSTMAWAWLRSMPSIPTVTILVQRPFLYRKMAWRWQIQLFCPLCHNIQENGDTSPGESGRMDRPSVWICRAGTTTHQWRVGGTISYTWCISQWSLWSLL